jgi:hypothetical protein
MCWIEIQFLRTTYCNMWTYYIPIVGCSHSLPTATVFFSRISIVISSSRSSLLIWVFVFDIFQIPSGYSQICSGYSALTSNPLTMGLPRLPRILLWYTHFTEKWQTFMLYRSLSKHPSFCLATVSTSLTSFCSTLCEWLVQIEVFRWCSFN